MKKIRYIIAFVLFVAFNNSCTHNFDEYNQNPNQANLWDISPTSLLEEIIFTGTNEMVNRTKLLNGELMQYTVTGASNYSYHRYVISNSIMASTWNSLYIWANNADHVYKLCDLKDPDKKMPEYLNCRAIALTMKAFYLANAADIYGDVPCSEAFQSLEGNFRPVFDTQKDVYKAVLSYLEQANEMYDVSKTITRPTKDLLYNGNMAKWKKFNNSFYLRSLLRLSNRNSEMQVYAKIKDILVDNVDKYPVFTGNEDNATLFYSGVNPFLNPFGDVSVAEFSTAGAAKNMMDMMATVNDPRISLYYQKNGSFDWKGLPSGESLQDVDNEGISLLNKAILGSYASPYSLMKYDEILFIKAEAAKRGIIPGGEASAEQYYEQAIRSSVKYWESVDPSGKTISDGTINNFIVRVSYDGTLKQILDQKYIALFWVGYESWHEYRRTGFPKLKIGSATGSNKYILPTRLAYPINTASTNPENYAAAVSRLESIYKGGDNMRTPVWWSKQAADMQ